MMKHTSLLTWLIVTISSLVFAAETSHHVAFTRQQQQTLGVRTATLQAVEQYTLFNAPAVVEVPPSNETIINSPQAGFAQQLLVSEGESVTQGQLLAIINSPDLLSLQNDYLQAYSQLQLAENAFQRDRKLYDDGIISRRRWQQTQTRQLALQSSLQQTLALLEIAGFGSADINRLQHKRQLDSQLKIVAPIAGVILERNVDIGQKVERLDPLFHLADLKQLWLNIQVPQEQVDKLLAGDQVTSLDQHMTASVTLIHRGVDRNDQTVLVRAAIIQGGELLRVGQQLAISLMRKADGDLYRIPLSAIVRHQGQSYIFEQATQGFQVRPIELVSQQDSDAVITGDLNPSTHYATASVVAIKAAWLGLGGNE